MTPDVRLEQKVNSLSQSNGAAATQSTAKTPSFIPIGQSGGDADNDVIKESYGITDFTKLTEEEKVELILKSTGMDKASFESLPESEKENYKKCLDAAVKYFSKNGKTPNANDITNKTKEYIIAKLTGWGKVNKDGSYDFSAYDNRQKDNRGLGDYLGKFSPEIRKKGFANVSPEEQKRAIKASFNEFFKILEKKGKSHDYIVKAQLQTFGRILINSSDEERTMFKEVVKQLLAENLKDGDRAVLESLDKLELKQAYAESFSYEDEKELTNPDRYGNTVSKEDLEAVYTEHKKYQREEVLEKTHNDFKEDAKAFFDENKEIIETIKEKTLRGEELNEEEQKVQNQIENLYEAYAASETVGTAINVIIDDDAKTGLLAQYNYDNYSLGEDFYRNVIDEINYIAQTHPEIVTTDIEEFTKLMDSVTDGNYSTVLSDIENNTTTQLTTPVNPQTDNAQNPDNSVNNNTQNTPAKQSELYINKKYSSEEIKQKQELIKEKKCLIMPENKSEVKTQKLSANNLKTNNDFKETVDEHGLIPTIKFVFKNFEKITTSVANTAIAGFKVLSNEAQASLIQTSSGKGLRVMLKNVSSFAVLNKLNSDRMFNLADAEVVEEKIQKQKELMG